MQKITYSPTTRSDFLECWFNNVPKCNPPSSSEICFAVLKVGHGIYGVGRTHISAITDAERILGVIIGHLPFYTPGFFSYGTLCIAHCTRRFCEKVQDRGGAIYDFVEFHGLIDIKE